MKTGKKKAIVTGYSFDCLPGHVQVTATGYGSCARVAGMRAIEALLTAPALKGKRLREFRATFIVTDSAVARDVLAREAVQS